MASYLLHSVLHVCKHEWMGVAAKADAVRKQQLKWAKWAKLLLCIYHFSYHFPFFHSADLKVKLFLNQFRDQGAFWTSCCSREQRKPKSWSKSPSRNHLGVLKNITKGNRYENPKRVKSHQEPFCLENIKVDTRWAVRNFSEWKTSYRSQPVHCLCHMTT